MNGASWTAGIRTPLAWTALLVAVGLWFGSCDNSAGNAGEEPDNDDDDTVTQPNLEGDLQPQYRDLVFVPAGTFTQKDTSENSFSHSLSRFTIAQYEVTYELWHTVRQWAESTDRPLEERYTFPSNQGQEGSNGAVDEAPGAAKNEPVVLVNWRTAMVWLNAYSEMAGLNPVYFEDAEYTDPYRQSNSVLSAQAIDNPYVNWDANGYRLPTEGEWQFAASYQDGSTFTAPDWASGATADVSDAAATGAVSWNRNNSQEDPDNSSSRKTWPVGQKTANQLGIYDMSGNVAEWIWDWQEDYPSDGSQQSDYRNPENRDSDAAILRRGIRGSGYNSSLPSVGNRSFSDPWNSQKFFGIRPARNP